MQFLARRSALIRLLPFLCVSALSAMTFGQHTAAPVMHPPAAPVHVSPPPIYRPNVMPMPVTRPANIYAPVHVPILTSPTRVPIGVGPSIVLPPVRPIRPIRPHPPLIFVYSPRFVFGEPFWPNSFCTGWQNCNFFWPFFPGYATVSSPGPVNIVSPPLEVPIYVYGDEREDTPQLFLTDGTILNVTDYWVTDGELHFKLIEQAGQKPVEHSIPFEQLDLQKTIDVNTARGFRFVLRNEPMEQYVHDHPDWPPPPLATPPAKPNS